MRAGVLTEPITFIRAEINKNEYGQEETIWSNYINTRSQVKYKSGNRITENNEIINTYTVEFIVRRYHKIDEFMRILWKNRKYRILAINEDKQSITITGELIIE